MKTYLENRAAGHSKFYELVLMVIGGTYMVQGTWGKIGAAKVASQTKYEGKDKQAAMMVYDEVLNTRFQHGYQIA